MNLLPRSLAAELQTPELERQREELVQDIYRLPFNSYDFRLCCNQLKVLDESINEAKASDRLLLEKLKQQIDQFITTYLKD